MPNIKIMVLPKTEAKTVDERRNEIVNSKDEYIKVEKYFPYEVFPEIKPHNSKPENLRFFQDGLEVLLSVTDSDRFIGKELRKENQSVIDTRNTFQLIDEKRKRILHYTIDAIKGEY